MVFIIYLNNIYVNTKHTTAVDGISVSSAQTLELTPAQIMDVDSTDYADNLTFKKTNIGITSGAVSLGYQFGGGYLSVTATPFRPHNSATMAAKYVPSYLYYLRDHLGSNRMVVSGDGAVEQANEYYPYGGPWGDVSTNQGYQPFKYTGKELDRVHGLDWYDYGARMYDPAFCQFTQMDPLCEQYPHLSPYAYCAGNPVRYVDPDGRNPIFNRKGIFLRVDDWGMKGDALFFDMDKKDFTFKYSHEEAVRMDLGKNSLLNDEAKELYLNTYNNLPNRPDWDGYITLKEANDWYRKGNQQPLFSDFSQIDMSSFISLGDNYVGKQYTFNLLEVYGPTNDALVYGNLTFTRLPYDKVRAERDFYDFDMHPWNSFRSIGRNIETVIGNIVAGRGKGFPIYFYGSQQLKKK
jgi:RHS repeat-associated protein